MTHYNIRITYDDLSIGVTKIIKSKGVIVYFQEQRGIEVV